MHPVIKHFQSFEKHNRKSQNKTFKTITENSSMGYCEVPHAYNKLKKYIFSFEALSFYVNLIKECVHHMDTTGIACAWF